jgi:cytochrome c oxidase cbb3-type subunit 1
MIALSPSAAIAFWKCTMEESMNLYMLDELAPRRNPRPVASAAWHALFWLVFANATGILIAVLLLFPALNRQLGEWTYGRWIMVHMNLELYGWTSLPMVAFLFRVYGADRKPLAQWCRPVLWVWSASLVLGAFSWLSGYSSGKLFLDWSGYTRILFPAALLALWLLLVFALVSNWSHSENAAVTAWAAKLAGLVVLLAVPFLIYIASSPNAYPPVNPDTGGPTGASQLESSLAIVAVLLMLPFGLTRRKANHSRVIAAAWAVLAAEALLCAALGRADISHRNPVQYLSLGSLLLWLPLMPAYYAAFQWYSGTRRWRYAFLWWWGALVLTGWIFFLPGILDHFKFTDGLVGHSFVAMAGFTSSLVIFVMVQLMGRDGWIFNRTRSFYLWNGSVIAYILLMTIAGWREGFDPTFTIVPGAARNLLYALRLVTGILMFLASLDWLIDASALLREQIPKPIPAPQEKTA